MSALGLGLIPLFKNVFPQFLILRIIFYSGAVIGVNTPFLPDYVEKNSIGMAMIYVSITVTFASVFV